MNRTVGAVLRYTREDFKWVFPVLAILILFCEGLGVLAVRTGDPDDAPKLVLGILLGLIALVNLILSVVYLGMQFPMFLSFSAFRRGLISGILLHCLRLSLLQLGVALVVGTLDALIRGASLPWQWIPWPVWPAVLLLPLWIGLFMGGLLQRFGPKGFWVGYFLLIAGCSSCGQWLHSALDWLAVTPWQLTVPVGLLVFAGLAAMALRWLGRSSVS